MKSWQQLRAISSPIYQIIIAGKADVILEIKILYNKEIVVELIFVNIYGTNIFFINRKGGNKASGVKRLL